MGSNSNAVVTFVPISGGQSVNLLNNNPMASVLMGSENLKVVMKRGTTSVYTGVNQTETEGLFAAFGYVKSKRRSVYLGRYDNEEEAARAHDIVTLKCSGAKGKLNFPASDYDDIVRLTSGMTDEEIVAHIRRSASRFARGCSDYRGVGRYADSNRWFGHKSNNKDVMFLGKFDTQEEAAMAFDIETIKVKGWSAQTNFSLSLYDVEGILQGTRIPKITEQVAKNMKEATVFSPLGELPQSAGSLYAKIRLPQNNPPPYGFQFFVPRVDNSYQSLFNAATSLMMMHPNTSFHQEPNKAYYCDMNGVVNMFRHSSSSSFKRYKRN